MASAGATVVAADSVVKRFGEVDALRGVSFAWSGPQVIGVLGPNGAGKTTLLEILEGLSAPTSGAVSLFGAEVAGARAYPRRRVGVVLQKEFALDAITVAEYAELFAAIHGVAGGRDIVLRAALLESRARVRVDRLSGGEAQRLFIAAAVVHAPDLLFLDEPSAHLDPASKGNIAELVRAMAGIRTVVITTHDLREAEAVCDRVVFLVGGRIRAEGTPAELVAAVPDEKRRGRGLEDAFFHFCAARIGAAGALEEAAEG